MKQALFLFVILLASTRLPGAAEVPRLHDEYEPAKWPQVELKLSQAATLKDIFDSGIRPYRHPGLENSLLEVKHLNLRIHMGSGKTFPRLHVELVNITPFHDGEIATMEGFTSRLTLAQGRSEMLKWLPYGTNGRTEKDLDDFLNAVKSDFLDFDDRSRGFSHGCSVNWKDPGWKTEKGGAQVTAWFRKTASQSFPLKLYFKISWESNRPIKDSNTIHDGPISPPPGYADVDMTAPKKFGPDSMAEILESKGVDIGRGRGHVGATGPIPSGIPTAFRLASGKARWPILLILLLILLLLIMAGWLLLRRRRASPSALHSDS